MTGSSQGSTCRLLPAGAVTEALGELPVKGRREPVVAHHLRAFGS